MYTRIDIKKAKTPPLSTTSSHPNTLWEKPEASTPKVITRILPNEEIEGNAKARKTRRYGYTVSDADNRKSQKASEKERKRKHERITL